MGTQPARGMRDFLPDDVRRRDYVVGIVREVYDRYGFEPIETPAAENIDTLLGKYGEEGSKLVFKILKRGEHEASGQADLALRYDLTVPFARIVAEYHAELPKIFKRYQIQPVWRAERPARGRFREFYQCDIDAIGSTSPMVEAEQIGAVAEVLDRLGFHDFTIVLNHRAVLTGILEASEIGPQLCDTALVALDKLDKIGEQAVEADLHTRGVPPNQAARLMEVLRRISGRAGNEDRLQELHRVLDNTPFGGAVGNLDAIVRLVDATPAAAKVAIDPRLARGLSYYTGAIMEITVPDLPGSLGGGGRYDNLIGMFLGSEVPACGFSLGLERIVVVMQERGMFPATASRSAVDVVVAAIDDSAQTAALDLAATLRKSAGLRVDLYPDVARKMDRIFKYVDQRKARFIAVLGSDEVAAGTVTLRNVAEKTRDTMPRADVAAFIQTTGTT
jgi:histidyl-tRNA synthetase